MKRLERDSEKKRIGRIGESQLHDFLTNAGWIVDKPDEDIGEDRIVRILDKYVFSGLHFCVQVKSTQDIQQYARSNADFSFSVKVKDLEHWEGFAIPVLLALWDIGRRHGYWIDISAAILQLNNVKPNWRNQRKVSIHIPKANAIDENGLKQIRGIVANHLMPVIAKGKDNTLKLRMLFPSTPEGRAKAEEVERALDVGDDISNEGEYIVELSNPDWYNRVMGEQNIKPKYLHYGGPVNSPAIPMQLHISSSFGDDATLSYLEFKVTKLGLKQITLSNEHQLTPLHFTIVGDKAGNKSIRLDMKLGKPCNVRLIKEAMEFLRVGATGSCNLIMTRLDKSDLRFRFGIEQLPTQMFFSRHFEQTINDLCLIQNITGRSLDLSDWQIAPQDMLALRTILPLVRDGQTNISAPEISIVGKIRPLLERTLTAVEHGTMVEFGPTPTNIEYKLLGEGFDFETADFQGAGVPTVTKEAVEDQLDRFGDEDEGEIILRQVTGVLKLDRRITSA